MRRLLVALGLLAALVGAQAQDIGFSPPISVPSYLFNWNPASQLTNWAAAKAATLAGTSNTSLGLAGDSQSRGFLAGGTGPNGETTNQISTSWPTVAAGLVNAAGTYSASWENFWGSGNYQLQTTDRRIVTTGSFTTNQGDTAAPGLGGPVNFATAAGTLTFTTLTVSDTIEIHYIDEPQNFTYAIDGGAPVTVNNATSTGAIKTTTISGQTLSTHSIQIAWVSGTVFITGMNCYNSAVKAILFLETAYGGAYLGTNANQQLLSTQSPFNFGTAIKTLSPKLTVAMVGINDILNSEGAANFQTRLCSEATIARTTGDIIFVSFWPANTGAIPLATQQSYLAAMQAAALQCNVPMYDLWSQIQAKGGYTALSGAYWSDSYHPNVNGYALIARLLYVALFINS